MLKAFFQDSAVYGAARLLTGSITLLALPIYTHALPPADYGAVDLLTTIAAIVHVTVALEISQGFGRYVLAAEGAGARVRYSSTALWFTAAAYSAALLIAIPFAAPLSARLFGGSGYAHVIRAAAVAMWGTGLFNMIQNLLRYERRATSYAIVSVLFSALSVGITIWLLLIVNVGLVGLFVGQFVAALAAAGVGLWFTRDTVSTVFDWRRCREMLAFSLPLVPSAVGVLLSTYVDRYAIVRLLSLEELGLYGVAFRLASVVGVAMAGVVSAVAPLLYQHHHEPGTPAQVARLFRWFLAAGLPLILWLGLFAPELVQLVAPPNYLPAAGFVFLLSAAILASSCVTFAPGLWIANRTGWIAVIGLSTGALNLALNFVFIPRLGLAGAALSNLTTALVACVVHFTASQAFYRVPFEWRRIAAAAGLVGAIALASIAPLAAPLAIGPSAWPVRAALWLIVSSVAVTMLLGAGELQIAAARLRRIVG